MEPWAEDVTGFWFSLRPEQWWRAEDALDDEIRTRFLELWEQQSRCLISDFLGSPKEALAAVILFDQFPRNMFRGKGDSFATDHMALQIAKAAVERGFDDALEPAERGFLYMPFQHSENSADQAQSLLLFSRLGDPEQLRFAQLHHDVIERFGRFPHRNTILGRAPRPDEIEAGDVTPW